MYRAGFLGGRGAVEELRKEAALDPVVDFEPGSYDLPDTKATKYASERAAELVTQIDEGTRADMRRRVGKWAGDKDAKPEELRRSIREAHSMSRERADMIARTELSFARNRGNLDGYQSYGVSQVLVHDGGAFDGACSSVDGAVWSIQDAWDNPVQHPNCGRSFSAIEPAEYVDDMADEDIEAEIAGMSDEDFEREISGLPDLKVHTVPEEAGAPAESMPHSHEEWTRHPEYDSQIRMHQELFNAKRSADVERVSTKFENSSTSINRYYRQGGPKPKGWTKADLDKMDDITRAHTVEQETYVYRGVQGSRGLPDVGATLSDEGYSSVTVRYNEAREYTRAGVGRANTGGADGYVYRIKLEPGQEYGGRLHPVLPRGTEFRVTRVRAATSTDPAIVDLEIVPKAARLPRTTVEPRAREALELGRGQQAHETAVILDDSGKVLYRQPGGAHEVAFTDDMIRASHDGHILHNHPSGGSFSWNDIDLAITSDARSITAIGTNGLGERWMYVIERPATGWPKATGYDGVESVRRWAQDVVTDYHQLSSERATEGRRFLAELQANSPAEYDGVLARMNAEHYHKVMTDLHEGYPALNYRRVPWPEDLP